MTEDFDSFTFIETLKCDYCGKDVDFEEREDLCGNKENYCLECDNIVY